ncbi:MAG: DEAD/DEAH box helicase [Candidatus Wallbacteria bacterium]|nr:DEAD/DEAH box helicase [Candidatus Wallbacteria bacterium]
MTSHESVRSRSTLANARTPRSLAKHQRKYLANLLSLRWASDNSQRIGAALAGAQVDLNPHQIDAALFAFRSPLARGALLADEVGLGKTIEAGLVLSQRWAERRRRILVVTPASLRKQWQQELSEKFFLPAAVVDSVSYAKSMNLGHDPFRSGKIAVISYEYAKARAADLQAVDWDIVVFDEAHRLRNVNRPANVIAKKLRETFAGCQKLLLTATPFQNSLSELFGLISFIDDHIFGELSTFRQQAMDRDGNSSLNGVRDRLMSVCYRSLRRQVEPYIRYTRRLPIVQEFSPTAQEAELYQRVSGYLQQSQGLALAAGSRFLVAMVLRKLLASSTMAIAGALGSMARRMRSLADDLETRLVIDLATDYDLLPETVEEWAPAQATVDLKALREAAEAEADQLEALTGFAESIDTNAKAEALIQALDVALRRSAELGAPEKAVIFTESRRTQQYLMELLPRRGYGEGLASFNGSNTDPASTHIYKSWRTRWKGSDRVTGSRSADVRTAIVDYFREEGRLLIATEAAAEGINLQFCSLVINYDLPWNPQRVEQRIGRCHRYGQRHDVVVVNFLNEGNAADRRVLQLLSDKFHLFEGVFGASDGVLGALESGVDLERRIADIYQTCRTDAEIDREFDRLQNELTEAIDQSFARAKLQLLENFDDEVREKLRVRERESVEQVGAFDAALMDLTFAELGHRAIPISASSFELVEAPPGSTGARAGLYELPRQATSGSVYRLDHPLAQFLIRQAHALPSTPETVEYHYSSHSGKISALEPFIGSSGWLAGAILSVSALDQVEDRILLAAKADDGSVLDPDLATRLVGLPSTSLPKEVIADDARPDLHLLVQGLASEAITEITTRNHSFYQAEAEKLGAWAEDLKEALERDIKEIDALVREARRQALGAATLEEKLAGQRDLRRLERRRADRRKELFESQDRIDVQRDALITQVERKLTQKVHLEPLFTVRWSLT